MPPTPIRGGFRNQRELLDFGKTELKDLKLWDALNALGEDYVEKIGRILKDENKVASGNLLRSLGWEVLPEVDKLILNLYSDFYLEYVAKGRRAGAKPPPYRALIPWIQRRGIVFQGKSQKTTAIIIAKSIGKKGIKPVSQITDTLRNIFRNKEDFIAKAAREDIEDIVYNYLVMGTLR